MTLQLLTTKTYNGIEFDCYVEAGQTSDFWATRTQIGELLGYSDPMRAIAHIHERNKERLDRFSTVAKLNTVEGGRKVEREVTLYDFKGLLEICRYSHKPKANAVMDWLFDVADEIRRTGSYTLKKSPEVPQGMFEAAERIVSKALACTNDEEYKETLTLDKVFRNMYGKSALDLAGLSIYEMTEYVAMDNTDTPPLLKYNVHFELKNSLYWERRETLVNPEADYD